MRKVIFFLILLLPLCIKAQVYHQYDVISWERNGIQEGIKITTRIPFTNEDQHPTLDIKGYCYNTSSTIGLKLAWGIHNGAFVNATASSSGGFAPEITLAEENSQVVIFLAAKDASLRLNITAFAIESEESANWFSGWALEDNVLSGNSQLTVPYENASDPQTFTVLNWFTNTEVENGIKIKTRIPITAVHMPVIHIEGYDYATASVIDLKIAWSGIGDYAPVQGMTEEEAQRRWIEEGGLRNFTVSSSGGFAPPVYIGIEDEVVVLYLDKWVSRARFRITAFTTGLHEDARFYSDWNVQDVARAESAREVSYHNEFRDDVQVNGVLTARTASVGEAHVGNLTINGDANVNQITAARGQIQDLEVSCPYGGGVTIHSCDGGIEIANGIHPTTYVDFKGVGSNGNHVGDDYQGRVLYSDNSGFEFYTDGVYESHSTAVKPPKMTISTSGVVSIGTGSLYPNAGPYKLFVEGGMRTRKVKVDLVTPWPDYVFEPSYDLRSLGGLEAYIKEFKHLPDVPSADEASKNGVDLGETQAVLLKKIEELTLYVIEQNKRMDAQQKMIEEQQKLLTELKNELKK